MFDRQNDFTDTCLVTKTANRLRVLRAERRWNQRKTAQKARIGFDRYWRIENGHTEPTGDEIASLANLFKVTPSEVFPWAVTA